MGQDTVKHTPGPWKAEKIYGEWNVYDAEENLVATIHGAEAHEQRPNAHLIAANPELLEAAKCVLDYAMLDTILADQRRHKNEVFAIRIGDLRALASAISKAMGGGQ